MVMPTITPLPDPPETTDPANFNSKADALLGALPDFVTEANALAVAMEAQAQAIEVAAAGGALAVPFEFSTTTTDADPTAGKMRLNHATQNLATQMFLDDLDSEGRAMEGVIALFDDSTSLIKGFIRLQHATDPTKFLIFTIGAAVTDASGYSKVPVVCVHYSSASPFAAADIVLLDFIRTGDKGDVGASTPWVAAGGTANALTGTYAPAIASLTDGLELKFRAASNITSTTPTFSPNGLTARTIVRSGGQALLKGDIIANAEYVVVYNLANTRWELLNPSLVKQISFFAYRTGDVTNFSGDGSVNTWIANTEVYDYGSCYDHTTGQFTAPVAGILEVNFSASIYSPAGAPQYKWGYINCSTAGGFYTPYIPGVTGAQNDQIGGSFTISLAAGETAQPADRSRSNAGTKVLTLYGGVATYWSGKFTPL